MANDNDDRMLIAVMILDNSAEAYLEDLLEGFSAKVATHRLMVT